MMNPAITSFLVGACGLSVFALACLVVLRFPGKMSPVARQALLAMVIHLATTLFAVCWIPEFIYWHGTALYWFGFNCWLFGFSAVYKSVSLRILTELSLTPEQALPLSAIRETHVLPCFTERTNLLVQGDLALQDGSKFTITAKGQELAARFERIQRFFGVRQSGLYGRSEGNLAA